MNLQDKTYDELANAAIRLAKIIERDKEYGETHKPK